MEKGISGSPVTINGTVVAIVTDIEEPGRKIIAVPIPEAIRLLPRLQTTTTSRRAKYDISWMPAPMRSAIEAARDAATRAEAEVERGHAAAEAARSGSASAVPKPNNVSDFDNTSFYYWNGDSGISEARSQVKIITHNSGRWTVILHGLGVERGVAGEVLGKIMSGRFVDNTLRSGELINGTTPSNPKGTIQITGIWDENGNFLLGSETTESESDLGEFTDGKFKRGYILRPSGSRRAEGTWDAKGQAHGYVVVWNEDSSFAEGGRYDHGDLVEPVSLPH